METEIWKDIPWYEWLYQISSLWNIKSINYNHTKKSKVLSPWDIWKYYNICLSKYKRIKVFSVHRLVAQSFLWLDINDKKMFVCHKDDDGHNNRIDNLFLWTNSDNIKDCVKKWKNNSYKVKIIQYWINESFICEWDSITDIKNILWIKIWNITHCCRWRRKTAWWFIWKYK